MYSKALIFAALTLAVHAQSGNIGGGSSSQEGDAAAGSGSSSSNEDPSQDWAAGISSLLADVDPRASSMIASLTSAIPSSVIGALFTDPAALASEVMGSSTPSWYQALPTELKSVISEANAEQSSLSSYYSAILVPTDTAEESSLGPFASRNSSTATTTGSTTSSSTTSSGSNTTSTSQSSRSTSASASASASSSSSGASSASGATPATATRNLGPKPTGAMAASVAGMVGMLGVAVML